MIECIFSSADIQSVAVGEEWTSTQFFYQINNNLCIVWTKICKVSRFTKVNLDCSIFVFKINVGNACFFDQMI